MTLGKRSNVIYLITARERGVKSSLRCNLNIMTRLVCCKKSKFVKVWETHSNKLISYEGGKLYFDNYRSCFTIHGHGGVPQLLYQLKPCSTEHMKIEEGLICQCPVDLSTLSTDRLDHRGSFLALTSTNHLIRYDINTGQLLERIFLSNCFKFRHLSWDNDAYTVCVKSTHKKMPAFAREAGIRSSLLMALAVFSVYPLKLVGMMEVTKQIFGSTVTDAMITHGVLIVLHQGGLVKLYSFQHVLKMGRRNTSPSESHLGNILPQDGLIPNIKLTECPPVLFAVRCSEHMLRLGGIPWHYIITPPGSSGCFRVYDLDHQQLADGGHLDLDCVSIEPDKCLFHPDDSTRILHVGAKQIQVHQLKPNDPNSSAVAKCWVDKLYTIDPFRNKAQHQVEAPLYTSSGRAIKRTYTHCDDCHMEDSYENIVTVDYENDLDLLFVGLATQNQGKMEGRVQLYDNNSGDIIKEVVLEENWKEFCDHIISLDLDTLVHIVKAPMRKFSCYVYQLHRDGESSSKASRCVSESKRQRLLEQSLLPNHGTRPRRNRRHINYDDT